MSSSQAPQNRAALDGLYKEIILDHNKCPRNFGESDQPDLIREGYNPLCGDRICLQLKLKDGKISECKFKGEGCSICIASSSIMTEEIVGESVEQVKSEIERFRELMQGKLEAKDFEGDVEALAGVRKFPVRIKCALLGWTTLKDALECGECKNLLCQQETGDCSNDGFTSTE